MSSVTNQNDSAAFSHIEPLEPRLLLSAVDVTVELSQSIIPIGATATLTVYGQVSGEAANEPNNGIFGWGVDLLAGTPSIISPLSPANVTRPGWSNDTYTSSSGTAVANGLDAIYDNVDSSANTTMGLGSRVVLFTVTVTATAAGSTTLTVAPDYTVGTDFLTWQEDQGGNYAAASITLTVLPLNGQVTNREIFYNNSLADGNNPGANASDDAAIDTGKEALLPGQDAGLANFTGYAKGINGIMIDVAGLLGTPSASDFLFQTSADGSGWVSAAAPQSITVRTGAGVNGSDRLTIIWADNAIQDGWLRVEMLPSITNTLAQSDVFYWGNLRGDFNGDAEVSQADLDLVLLNYSSAAPANWVNGRPDGNVSMAEYNNVMSNWGESLTLFSAPAGSQTIMAPLVSEPISAMEPQTAESPAYFLAEEPELLDMTSSSMVAMESTIEPELAVAPTASLPSAQTDPAPRAKKNGQAVAKAKRPAEVEDILTSLLLMPL